MTVHLNGDLLREEASYWVDDQKMFFDFDLGEGDHLVVRDGDLVCERTVTEPLLAGRPIKWREMGNERS